MSEKTLIAILEVLQKDPSMADTLKQITEYERGHYEDKDFGVLGWEWRTFRPTIEPQTLHRLHTAGILRLIYSSDTTKGYLTSDPAAILKALRIFDACQTSTRKLEIMIARYEGKSYREICKQFKISPNQLQKIFNSELIDPMKI